MSNIQPPNQDPQDTRDASVSPSTKPVAPSFSLPSDLKMPGIDRETSSQAFSIEWLQEQEAELAKIVSENAGNWLLSSKADRVDRLMTMVDIITEYHQVVCEATNAYLSELPEVDERLTNSPTVATLTKAVNEEFEHEELLLAASQSISSAYALLAERVYAEGKLEFQASTGFLDDMPKTSGAFTTGFAVAGLAPAVYFGIVHHHAISHAAHAITDTLVGHSLLAGPVFATAWSVGALLYGTAILATSAVGPLLYAGLKSLGGKAVRATSQGKKSFVEQQALADTLLEYHKEAISHLKDSHERLHDPLIHFFDRNDTFRLLAAPLIENERRNLLSPISAEVRQLDEALINLGRDEDAIKKSYKDLESKLSALYRQDFRSASLRKFQREEKTQVETQKTPGWTSIFTAPFSYAGNAIKVLENEAETVGSLGNVAKEYSVRAQVELGQLKTNVFRDPFAGLAKGMSSALEIALDIGLKPEQAILDATNGIAEALNFGQEGKKSVSLRDFFEVVFELEELEHGSLLRWGPMVAVNLLLAIVKKPGIIKKVYNRKMARGELSPESVEKQLEKDATKDSGLAKRRWQDFWSGVKHFGVIMNQATLGLAKKAFTEWPLRAFGAHQSLKELYESRASHYRNIADKRSDSIQNPATLFSEMTDKEFDVHMMTTYVEYVYGESSSISLEHMAELAKVWQFRRRSRWYLEKIEQMQHQLNHKELNPFYSELSDLCRHETGVLTKAWTLFSEKVRQNWNDLCDSSSIAKGVDTVLLKPLSAIRSMTDSLVVRPFLFGTEFIYHYTFGKLGTARRHLPQFYKPQIEDSISELPVPQKLKEFITIHNQHIAAGPSRAYPPVVLDSIPGYRIVLYQNRAGKLELLAGLDGARRLLEDVAAEDNQNDIVFVETAEEARYIVAEFLTKSRFDLKQRMAIRRIQTHLTDRVIDLEAINREMEENEILKSALVGEPASDGKAASGLLRLGVLGNRHFSEPELLVIGNEFHALT